jgi:hypothetical protein
VKLLQNRHFKAALLVSPVLAVISYVAVDHVVSEKPSAAVPGQSYRLAQKSNCRYPSGMCALSNGDVEILIRAQRRNPTEVELSVSAGLPIDQVFVSWGHGERFSPPIAMAGSMEPTARVTLSEPGLDSLRWAVTIRGATYFAETPAVFVDHETPFPRDDVAASPEPAAR